MRQQRPTTLILAVSLALFANAALAQRATTGGGARVGAGAATATATAPAAGVNASSNTSASTSANAGTNFTVPSGQQGIVANTSGGNQVVFGVPPNGTQGSNTANGNGTNPQPNVTQGQTSGTSNGTTTGTSNGSTSPGVVPSGVANLQARLFDANGNMLTDANGRALLTDGVSVIGFAPVGAGFEGATIGVDPNQVVVANAMLAPTSLAAGTAITPELDRATRKELGKARQASRSNKQLLTSIAPRTNVDRTDQMADDPMPVRY